MRRALILKAAAYSLLAFDRRSVRSRLVESYRRNRDLIAETETAVGPVSRGRPAPSTKETVIADRDLHKVDAAAATSCATCRPAIATRDAPTPLLATFGLEPARAAAVLGARTIYHVALERMFRSRLIFRLEEVLEANRQIPGFVYEALKVYLMLGGVAAADRELVLAWMRRDWADNLYPGAGNADGRKALEEHLVAMLDLEEGDEPLIEPQLAADRGDAGDARASQRRGARL